MFHLYSTSNQLIQHKYANAWYNGQSPIICQEGGRSIPFCYRELNRIGYTQMIKGPQTGSLFCDTSRNRYYIQVGRSQQDVPIFASQFFSTLPDWVHENFQQSDN